MPEAPTMLTVTVSSRAQHLEVRGLAAALIVLIAVHAARINQLAVGRVVGHIANGKVHLEFRESSEPIRIEE
jgi:hypothetical protein